MIQRILTAFCMCLRTYSCLPLPSGEWDDDLNVVAPAFLPAVGLLVGLVWWMLAALAKWLLPDMLAAVLVAAFPFVITGLLHLKGYWKVSEFLFRGRKGLADAPAGFIPAMLLALLMLLQFAACASAERIFPLVLIPVLSRACCALHTLKKTNTAADEEQALPAALLSIEKCIAVAAVVLMLVFSAWTGLLAGGAVMAGYALCSRILAKDIDAFDDACGFALTVAELCGLLVLAIV